MEHRKSSARVKILAISDGRAGIMAQAIGLAQAVAMVAGGRAYHTTVRPTLLQRAPTIRRLLARPPKSLIHKHADATIVIGCGSAIAPIVTSFGAITNTFTAWIQRQPPDSAPFDAVIVPQHDRVAGDHVLQTIGALNSLNPVAIAGRGEFAPPHLQALPQPRLALLIGGSNRAYRLDAATCQALTTECLRAARRVGGSTMLTTSRRTGADCLEYLQTLQAPDLYQWHWSPQDPNPYLDILALADVAAVTVDSVNMISEASSVKLPVLMLPLPNARGKGAASAQRRLETFHHSMRARDLARHWLGWLDRWEVPGLHETRRSAEWLWRHYLMKRPEALQTRTP